MKALVTGGSGYFGSLLVKRLISNNWKCKVLDINPYSGLKEVEFIRGDVRNIDLLKTICNGVDVIFHNVAQVPLAKDKHLFNSVNIDGTINILQAAKLCGVKKLVYTSSSAVYGIPSYNPVTETMLPEPKEDYGKAKYIAEKKCLDFISDELDIIVIRPRTILGHGRLGVFQILFEWIKSGHNIPVLGNGDNIYQFLHADDLAEAIILASAPNVKSGIYNCGAENYGTMRAALENLCKHAKSGSKVKNVPFKLATFAMKISSAIGISPLGDYHALMYGRDMYFDINKAKVKLSWKPQFSNDEMFKESYDWYCSNRNQILNGGNIGSRHQSKVKEGILSIIKMFL